MSITSVLPPFILMALYLFLAYLMTRYIPFFKHLIENKMTNSSVHLPIEGLRGFLALSVFFCHAAVSYFYFKNGAWDVAPSVFYSFLSPFGVLLFFFITGYLFWARCLNAKHPLKIISFYASRFKRIMPAYMVSLVIIIFIVGIETHFCLHVSLAALVNQIFKWLILGVPFAEYPAINQYLDTGIIDAGVYWTLRFEILFYLAIPLLAFFAKGLRLIPLLIVFAVIFFLSQHYSVLASNKWSSVLVDFSKYMTLGFSFGMISAFLKKNFKQIPSFLGGTIGSLISIGAIGLQFVFIHDVYKDNYQYLQSLLLFIPFILIVFGNNLFGLLISRGALLLGSISYSVYLFHGIVLFVVLRSLNLIYPIVQLDPLLYWGIIGVIGVLTLFVSAISYRYIEHTCMRQSFNNSQLLTYHQLSLINTEG